MSGRYTKRFWLKITFFMRIIKMSESTLSRFKKNTPFLDWLFNVNEKLPIAWHLMSASLKKDIANTYLGFLWWILEPLLLGWIYYIVFNKIMGYQVENYWAFLLIGLIVWRWFQMSLNSAAAAIMSYRGIFMQVNIPKIIFPISLLLNQFFRFFIGFILLIAYLSLCDIMQLIVLIPTMALVLLQILLILSLSSLLSLITIYLPDMHKLLPFIFTGLFFSSGIIFELTRLPEPYRRYLEWNPFAVLCKNFREVMLYGNAPNIDHMIYLLIFSLTILFIGLFLHWHFDQRMIKYLG